MLERTDDHASGRTMTGNGIGYRSCGDLFFDLEDKRDLTVPFQDLRQCGDPFTAAGVESPQRIERVRTDCAGPVGRPVDGGIVNDHRHPIGRDVKVQLQRVSALGDGAIESQHGVLRVLPRCTSVTDDRPCVGIEEKHEISSERISDI